jgi:hypothetical protein
MWWSHTEATGHVVDRRQIKGSERLSLYEEVKARNSRVSISCCGYIFNAAECRSLEARERDGNALGPAFGLRSKDVAVHGSLNKSGARQLDFDIGSLRESSREGYQWPTRTTITRYARIQYSNNSKTALGRFPPSSLLPIHPFISVRRHPSPRPERIQRVRDIQPRRLRMHRCETSPLHQRTGRVEFRKESVRARLRQRGRVELGLSAEVGRFVEWAARVEECSEVGSCSTRVGT